MYNLGRQHYPPACWQGNCLGNGTRQFGRTDRARKLPPCHLLGVHRSLQWSPDLSKTGGLRKECGGGTCRHEAAPESLTHLGFTTKWYSASSLFDIYTWARTWHWMVRRRRKIQPPRTTEDGHSQEANSPRTEEVNGISASGSGTIYVLRTTNYVATAIQS